MNHLTLASFHVQLQHICCQRRPKQHFQLLLQPIRCEQWRQTPVLGRTLGEAAPLQRDGVQLLHVEVSVWFRQPPPRHAVMRPGGSPLLRSAPPSRTQRQRAAELVGQRDWDSGGQSVVLFGEFFLVHWKSGHKQPGRQ